MSRRRMPVPTDVPAGSERVDVYAGRYARGENLWHLRDGKRSLESGGVYIVPSALDRVMQAAEAVADEFDEFDEDNE